MPNPRILIAVPMLHYVVPEFLISLYKLKTTPETSLSVEVGSLVYEARNKLVMKALEWKADYILWLDSDLEFPDDTLERLLRHAAAGAEVVSGIYFARGYPTKPIIAKTVEWSQNFETGEVKHDAELYYDYPQDSVFPIAGCGFGCVLTKVETLLKVSEACRMSPFNPLPGLGEDYSFCWRYNQMGGEILCDSSIKCGHVGSFVYNESLYQNGLKPGKETVNRNE